MLERWTAGHMLLHCVSKKRPIKIFALLESVWNLLQKPYDNTHLTLGMFIWFWLTPKLYRLTSIRAFTYNSKNTTPVSRVLNSALTTNPFCDRKTISHPSQLGENRLDYPCASQQRRGSSWVRRISLCRVRVGTVVSAAVRNVEPRRRNRPHTAMFIRRTVSYGRRQIVAHKQANCVELTNKRCCKWPRCHATWRHRMTHGRCDGPKVGGPRRRDPKASMGQQMGIVCWAPIFK